MHGEDGDDDAAAAAQPGIPNSDRRRARLAEDVALLEIGDPSAVVNALIGPVHVLFPHLESLCFPYLHVRYCVAVNQRVVRRPAGLDGPC